MLHLQLFTLFYFTKQSHFVTDYSVEMIEDGPYQNGAVSNK